MLQYSQNRLIKLSDKHAAVALPPSKVIGCDFSGTIESIGSIVKDPSLHIGDRVAGGVHGCHSTHNGAFAQSLVADAKLVFKKFRTGYHWRRRARLQWVG